jgi:hypothetical protein
MILGKLIEELKKHDPNVVVKHGFTNPHSYRGYYDHLAFEPASNVSVAFMIACAESALGATYEGWKGGEYVMDEDTPCWLAFEGQCYDSDEPITPLIIRAMLNHTVQ